jgi:hypothetical protein
MVNTVLWHAHREAQHARALFVFGLILGNLPLETLHRLVQLGDFEVILVDAVLQRGGFRLIEFHVGVDVGHGDSAIFLTHIVEGAVGEHLEQMGVDGQLVLGLLQLAFVGVQGVLQLLDAGALLFGSDIIVGELRGGDEHAVGGDLQAGNLDVRAQPIDHHIIASAF